MRSTPPHARRVAATATATACAIAALLATPPRAARAQTIASRTETTPYPGLRVIAGRTASPATNFHAAIVSLCTDYVHMTATRYTGALQRPSSWGAAAGVQLATNGDFFTTGPRVYGMAVGAGGVAWPVSHTGIDPAVADQWYYRRYGWIAFGAGWVEFSHTEYVKQHARDLGATLGFSPGAITTAVPRGALALVSGFPELITEGRRVTCSSPTASSCFPDRSDMRARNPRTAMGLSRDRRTFILVAVDGREGDNVGMYGTELARLMELLGAWQAFNLDGGGSTAMWLRGRGVISNPSDPAGERAVADHWGVFAGSGDGQARAAGSCFTPGGCFPTRVEGAEAQTFKDVVPGAAGAREIDLVFRAGLDAGCQTSPERFFCPACLVTRRALLAMLVRGRGLDTAHPPATPTFRDVPRTDPSFAIVEAAAHAGWDVGCGGGNFCPTLAITRAAAAGWVREAMGWTPVRPARASFSDVPATDPRYADVETIRAMCVSGGCGAGAFCPTRNVTRTEAAQFVARALDLGGINACLASDALDGGARDDAGVGIDPDLDADTPGDGGLDDDAGDPDDVPGFVDDSQRGPMPPVDDGCGCRAAGRTRGAGRGVGGGGALVALAAAFSAASARSRGRRRTRRSPCRAGRGTPAGRA